MNKICLYLLCMLSLCQHLFGDYGFIIKHEGKVPITKFTVIAERGSGSNYMEALLMFNTKVATTPLLS